MNPNQESLVASTSGIVLDLIAATFSNIEVFVDKVGIQCP